MKRHTGVALLLARIAAVAAVAIGIAALSGLSAGVSNAALESNPPEGIGIVFSVSPAQQTVPLDSGAAQVDVKIDDASDVAAFEFVLTYDPTILTAPVVRLGPFLESTGRSAFCPNPIVDSVAGRLRYGCGTLGFGHGVDGAGVVATVTFDLLSIGHTDIGFEKIAAANALAYNVCPCSAEGASIDVTPAATPSPTNTVVPTSSPTNTATPTSTATPTIPTQTATASPTPPGCISPGQRVSTLLGVVHRFGARIGDRRYNARFDIDHDGVIGVYDLLVLLRTTRCGGRR